MKQKTFDHSEFAERHKFKWQQSLPDGEWYQFTTTTCLITIYQWMDKHGISYHDCKFVGKSNNIFTIMLKFTK